MSEEKNVPSFEDALARLEQIVRELEGTDLSLEDTLARYEEGSTLVRDCTNRLEDAEQRIRVLSAAREVDTSAEATGRAGRGGDSTEGPEEGEDRADGDDLPF